jgi:hypothetical protein
VPGTEVLTETLRTGFLLVAADLTSTPPYGAAPLAEAVFLVVDVEFHPRVWVWSTSRALVDIERAPFPGVASRLSASSSNTRIPPLIRPYPARQKLSTCTTPASLSGEFVLVFSREETYRAGRAGGYFSFCLRIFVLQNPPYMASRQLLITRIAAAVTSFNPLPCQAWHGYMVTSRMEVEVGADGRASAPPSGAAAATPPAGAGLVVQRD